MKKILLILFIIFLTGSSIHAQYIVASKKDWLTIYDFNASMFKSPLLEFGPFARWWWPGNDVTKDELQRELNLFADNAFGGVEIQPFSMMLPNKLSKESLDRVYAWDTPVYYENLRAVMEFARKKGLIVDMTNGSGWPTGGAYLAIEDGLITLISASQDVNGGKQVEMAVPQVENTTGVASRLEAVLATKLLPNNTNQNSNTILLDPSSTIVLTSKVKNNTIIWTAPAGNWKIIAIWSKPQDTKGSMTASRKQGPVLNVLDSIKVFKNYDYLFGDRTGLQSYFGNPMRAIFTDSYEFAVDRHYNLNFLSFFKKQRGYDASPWLPANMQKEYNYTAWKNSNQAPDFSFGSEDWRLKYDYDLTVSELFQENFIKASNNWTKKRGLLLRTQAYGMKLDMIASAGHAAIPETETMLGPEAMLKVMASGAHLYNRPILSSESLVYQSMAYMTTPQKIRLVVDKLFAAGVNQIIYHGVPYRYVTDETKPGGWDPFCAPGVNFSSNLGESNIFWKYQKEVNEYIGRTQYALRSGKPHADVLIYFPFMEDAGMPINPQEILGNGHLEGVEPPLGEPVMAPSAAQKHAEAEKAEWGKKIYAVINQLEARGITWDWVNDPSIQEAKLDADKVINIRGNRYQALILGDISVIQLKSAEKINALTKKGMNFLVVGEMPSKQPSYLNWEANDKKTKQHIAQAIKSKNGLYLQDGNELLDSWIKTLNPTIRFNGKYTFTRQIQRDMSDGSRIQFICNKSDVWQPLSLTMDKKYNNACWMNAETGKITAVTDISNVSYVIPPHSSIILFAGTKNKVDSKLLSKPEPIAYQSKEVLRIEKWNISSDTVSVKNTALFDWRTNQKFKFSSKDGLYKSTFTVDQINPKTSYFLDLGKVYFTAEVVVNGKLAGKRINAPYDFNITDLLKQGENAIEVRVTPNQLNGFINEAEKGNKQYKAFKKNTGLMASGLVGPVVLSKK